MNKKVLSILLVLLLTLVGCTTKSDKKFKVGVVQYGDFASLNNTLIGIEEVLQDEDIELIVKNAQGEAPMVVDIVNQFVGDEVDLIVAITTQAAQVAAGATQNSQIPVVFACVSDPDSAGLQDLEHVTGVSDVAPLSAQFDLIESLTPNTKTIGVLFKSGDPNGMYQTKLIQDEGLKRGINIEIKGATEVADLSLITRTLSEKVDALYLITDGLIVGNTGIIVEEARRLGVYSFASEDGQLDNGVLATNSIKYTDIGKQAGEMVKKILITGITPNEIPIEIANETYPQINAKVAESFSIEIPQSLTGAVKK